MFKDYQTKVEYVTGLIAPGSVGINHGIAQDGKVALLTVKLLNPTDKSALAASTAAAKRKLSTSPAKERRISWLPIKAA
jgi:hypothetical protein